jgi:ABC-2 type transport system ATP-binding protein
MTPDDLSIRCESVGVAFTRGSRRTMLRQSIRRALRAGGRNGDQTFYDDPSTFWALRDVSFESGSGTILGVCGANGAGKTTLLRAISGIYQPDVGRVRVQGRTSVLLSLGALLAANLSGRVNVGMAAALHGIPSSRTEHHVLEVQEFAELDDSAMDTPVRYYSAGMRARLAFASASVLEPEILLVDELLGVGDAAFRKKSSDRLLELTAAARCVIIASHSTPFLKSLCDRVLWLEGGRLIGDGPADEVLDAYSRRIAGAPTATSPSPAAATVTSTPPPPPPTPAGSNAPA